MSRLDETLTLVAIASVSGHEAAIASFIESRLRGVANLTVERVGDNVVARTSGHHATRVLVAGHLDTVPGDASTAAIVGDELRGVGACDMKGSLAVMLALAVENAARSVEVTWVFYAREEISRKESGLLEIAELRPDLLVADVALLAEPTGGVVEAGCQGTLRVLVELAGKRAHAARPFAGRNAIHRLAPLIQRVADYEPRTVDIEGVAYTEQLQAVEVAGGVAANVVPDLATLTINHRFAPDRSKDAAFEWLAAYLAPPLDDADSLTLVDWSPSAAPSLTNERLEALVGLTRKPARGKAGWTDVATFLELNVPATNFGAGDPLLAHRSDEYVTLDELREFEAVLSAWLA